jgi:predicted component of viral defense system (DUF524 family)
MQQTWPAATLSVIFWVYLTILRELHKLCGFNDRLIVNNEVKKLWKELAMV